MSDEIQSLTVKVGVTDQLFQQGITRINSSMKLLQSEFKASSESLKNFGSSTEQLDNKSKYLNSAIELQKAKVQGLTEAYEKTKTQTGEFSTQTASAGTKVNNAVAYLEKLKNQLREVDIALEKTNIEEKKIDWKAGFEKAQSSVESTRSKLGGLKTGIVTLGATIAGGAGLYEFAKGTIDAGNSTYLLSQKLHSTNADTAQLSKMMSLAGVDINTVTTVFNGLDKSVQKAGTTEDKNNQKIQESIQKNNEKIAALEKSGKMTDSTKQKIQELNKQNDEYTDKLNKSNEVVGANSDTLEKYGVKLTDAKGKLLPYTDQLGILAKAYQKAADNGNEEAFATDVLGKKGQNLIPILQNYDDIKEKVSKQTGIGIDPAEAHKIEMELTQVKSQFAQLAGVAAKEVLPIISAMLPPTIKFFQQLTQEVKNNKPQIDAFVATIVSVGKTIVSVVVPPIRDLFNTIAQHGEASKVVILGLVGAFAGFSAVSGIFKGITSTVKTFSEGIKSAKTIMSNFKTGITTIGGAFNTLKGGIGTVVSAIGNFSKAMLTGIANLAKMTAELAINAAAWLAEKVQLVASTIAEGALTVAQGILNTVMMLNPVMIIVTALIALVAGLVLAYNKVGWFRDFVNTAFSAIGSIAQTIFGGIGSFIGGVWDGIKSGADTAINGVKSVWSGITGFFSGIGKDIKAIWDKIWNFKIPHIPLPHFSLSGSFNPLEGQIPSLGVNWYAKGGIFDKPSVIGVGENGKEAVMPLENNTGWIDTLADKLSNKIGNMNNNNQPIIVEMYLDKDKVGRAVAPIVSNQIARNYRR